MYRKICCVMILATLFSAGALSADEGIGTDSDEPTSFTSRILAVTDVVLKRHIDPPARQQMILSGVKALYRINNRQIPNHLSSDVSELATRAQFEEFLDGVHEEFSEQQKAEEILTLGMLRAVPGDSFIIGAKANAVNNQVLNNRYVGTGIQLSTNKEEQLTQITKVFYNGPAWHAGVKSLDLILEIDGESTESQGLVEVVEALRGESGSEVEVVVRQPDSDKSRRLTMTRGRVFIPSVEGVREQSDGQWQYTLDSAKEIAFIRLKSIGPSTLHELRQIAAKLRQQKVKGIVIDLRIGGGILHDIVMVADGLIDGGTIGHIRSLERTIKHEARSGDLFDGLPIAVLVWKNTSAGNVLLAAALQDNERAVIVGEPTAGETYVSSFVSIPGREDQLRLATAEMLRGDGTLLMAAGKPMLPIAEPSDSHKPKRVGFVLPDHVVYHVPRVAGTEQPLDTDPMLTKAVKVLNDGHAKVSASQKDNVHEK